MALRSLSLGWLCGSEQLLTVTPKRRGPAGQGHLGSPRSQASSLLFLQNRCHLHSCACFTEEIGVQEALLKRGELSYIDQIAKSTHGPGQPRDPGTTAHLL